MNDIGTRMKVLIPVILSVCAQTARAQTTPAFDLSYLTPNTTVASPLTPDTKAVFPTVSVGGTSTITVIVTNRNTTTWNLASSTALGAGFSIASTTTAILNPGAQSLITIAFTPAASGKVDGSLALQLSAGASTITLNAFLHAEAVQSQLVLSYILQPAGNQTPLGDRDTIKFPSTPVGTTSAAVIVVTNRGDGSGTFSAAGISGAGFSIAGLPLVPAPVAASGQPNAEIRFNVVFTPSAAQESTGALSVTLDNKKLTVNLDGIGTNASFQYAITANGKDFTPLAPNGTYAFAATNVGATTSVTVKVTNAGNGDGKIGAIAVANPAFTVTGAPGLPATLTTGNSLVFTLNFAPADSLPYNASLIIDNQNFNLSGVGVGAKLTFTTITAGTAAALLPNGTVLFPNTSVGASNPVTVRITNSGNADTTVSSVNGSGPPFTTGIPALPVKLAAGSALEIPITFAPTAVGAVKGTLQIDNFTFTLQGAGNPPPALPAFTFTGSGAASAARPLDQPAIGIKLSAPYSLDITGTLKLSFTSAAVADDPNIQFAAGGRTVSFRIPANSTDALFGQGQAATTAQFQAGTVAGTIT